MLGSDPITEIVREYSGMDTVAGSFTNYPTMSSRCDDFMRDNCQQQTSSDYSRRRDMHEIVYCFFSLIYICAWFILSFNL